MEILSFIFDFILLFGGVLAMYYSRQVGGSIGHNSLNFMSGGFFFFGIAHLAETILAQTIPGVDIEVLELSHRVLIMIGLIFILIGYRRLAKFVNS